MAKSVFYGFEWKVENVLSLNSQKSDEFVLCESRWRLHLNLGASGFINVWLTKLNPEKLTCRCKIRAFMEDRNEKAVNPKSYVLDNLDFANRNIWWIFREALQKQHDTYLTDGILTFIIVFIPKNSLETDAEGEKVFHKSIQTSMNMDNVRCLENLSSDLHNLMDGGVQSDVTLKCDERTFPAHKGILSARSEVFSAMFRSDMVVPEWSYRNGRAGIIQISDVDASVLDQFLHYIYSGKLSDLSVDAAPKLYAAADKYSIESLKKLCSKFMAENLTAENACKILVLSDTHGDKYLKDAALCFITNVELLRNKDMWVEFHSEHPKLASEVIHHAYEVTCLSKVH